MNYRTITSSGTGCIHCTGGDELTHSTEEHDEEYFASMDPCAECGAGENQKCLPWCEQIFMGLREEFWDALFEDDVQGVPVFEKLLREFEQVGFD